MSVLKGVKPEKVFQYFEEICAIPHGSYDTKRISDYCLQFARERGLSCRQDAANNVVIVKEAAPGYEQAGTVMLQGHLDMVCEKTPDSAHDFKQDGLKLLIDGEYLRARDTTLGGDDGIAVAYALAILDDPTLAHPRLEVVLTTEEEVGLEGAKMLDTSDLKATRLINLDSEEEGILLTSCAGGFRGDCVLPVKRETKTGIPFQIRVHGLRGGHSGTEINKGRANANKLMGRLLTRLEQNIALRVARIAGGQQDNAIAKDTTAELLVSEDQLQTMEERIRGFQQIIQNEYQYTDPDIQISTYIGGRTTAEVLTADSQKKVLFFLLHTPDGVRKMSPSIAGLVQTSLNLGIFALEEKEMKASFAARSSVASEKEALRDKLQSFMDFIGGTFYVRGDYPAWEYRADSPLRDTMVQIYQEQYGEEPTVEAVHAGLECGILMDKMGTIDAVSIGPDMQHVHTTDERLHIASVERVWNYLLRVLEVLK